jgi:uncharacterized membrane protein
MNSRGTNQIFSWIIISFFTTAIIGYLLIGNWIQTILLAAISVSLDAISFNFLENKMDL